MTLPNRECVKASRRTWLLVTLSCAAIAAGAAAPARAAKLHVIAAVDSKAERVGQDLTVLAVTAGLIGSIPREHLEFHTVDGSVMSEPALLETIHGVPAGPDDAVLFLYVGHGAYDPTLGTYLTPSGSTGQVLSATRIVQEVRALGARLAVVVIDCCNRERAPRPSSVVVPGVSGKPPAILPLADRLFFQSSGAVLIVSSSPGEYALVRARRDAGNIEEFPWGPLFMNAFGKSMSEHGMEPLDWPQLIGAAQRRLDRDFRAMIGPDGGLTLDDGTRVRQARQTIQLRLDP